MKKLGQLADPEEFPKIRASYWRLRHSFAESGISLDRLQLWDIYAMAYMAGHSEGAEGVAALRERVDELEARPVGLVRRMLRRFGL